MSLGSQQYADLARDAYRSYPTGSFARDNARTETIGGIQYLIRAHVDNPSNGYQGTIYQREDTGEIVVAHRGSEFDREAYKDGVLADAGMVLTRTNLQAEDAIALTRQAMEMVRNAQSRGMAAGPVTVTGHSLGGALAQISAHHFGLRGETFNAFGAASLNRRIPEGGDAVINHVMAGDVVSAASPHYGQVRVYAEPREVETLLAHGYDNRTHWSDALRGYSVANVLTGTVPPRTIAAAVALGDSHRMHHFVDVDAQGRPDRSVLQDPAALALAQRQSVQIGEYRQDLRQMRGVLTAVARGLGGGQVFDTIDSLRGPLQPGEPARRQPSDDHSPALPPRTQSLLDDSRRQIEKLAGQHGLPWDQGLENTVHAVASRANDAGLSTLTHLRVERGEIVFAGQDGGVLKEASVDARTAANTPVDRSMEALARAPDPAMPESAAPAMART